jgi:hypothetical protein
MVRPSGTMAGRRVRASRVACSLASLSSMVCEASAPGFEDYPCVAHRLWQRPPKSVNRHQRRPTPRCTGRGPAGCRLAGFILLGVRVRAGELGTVGRQTIMNWRISVLTTVALLALPSCATQRFSPAEYEAWHRVADSRSDDYQLEAICSIHHVATIETAIPAFGGMSVMPPKSYVLARIHQYPNAWIYVNTGFCEQGYPMPVVRWFCPECRKAELRWRRLHRYLLSANFDPSTGEWRPTPLEPPN